MKVEKPLNIMVTGGSGFLGSHVADALTEVGHQVVIFDLKPSPYLRPEQKMIIGDILEAEALNKAMKGIEIVFHLAAFADLEAASDRPVEAIKINVLGTTNVLEAARQNKVKRVIFASTIYVNSRTGSFYRVSKHAGELLFEVYKEQYGLDYVILRFGTLYGKRASESNTIFRFLKEALTTKKIDFPGSGDEVREYVNVLDAARICTKIFSEEFSGETLIITGHHRMKLRELLEMIREIVGKEVQINYQAEGVKSHYIQTPYSYIPRPGKKIVMDIYCDLGQSLVEILDEVNPNDQQEEMQI